MKEFLDSYYSCIERMDVTAVKPFTETEIQPIYSQLWLPYIEQLCDKVYNKEPFSIAEFIPNKSLIRSMLVMDLMDCAFTKNKELANRIFETYKEAMDAAIYIEDPYSLQKNVHGTLVGAFMVKDSAIKDGYYDNNPINKKILHWCYNLSYGLWQDIYADNTYEITGPFHTRYNTYIIQDFRNIPGIGHVRIVSEYDKLNIYDIKIDMFGHCDYKLHEPINAVREMILHNEYLPSNKRVDKTLLESQLCTEYKNIPEEDSKTKNLNSRFFRYQNLFDKFDIRFNGFEIHNVVQSSELHKRLNVAEIKELLNTLL